MHSFHQSLRDARVTAKISQEKLAEMIGTSQTTVSKWEAGQQVPNHAQLLFLIKAFPRLAQSLPDEIIPGSPNDVHPGKKAPVDFIFQVRMSDDELELLRIEGMDLTTAHTILAELVKRLCDRIKTDA